MNHPRTALPVWRATEPHGVACPDGSTGIWALQMGPLQMHPLPKHEGRVLPPRDKPPAASGDLCLALMHCTQLDFFQKGMEKEGWGFPKASRSSRALSLVPRSGSAAPGAGGTVPAVPPREASNEDLGEHAALHRHCKSSRPTPVIRKLLSFPVQ